MTNQSSPFERVTEQVALATDLQTVLEDSDRFWSGQVGVLEEQLALGLGLTKTAFDTLYYQALGSIQPGALHTAPRRDQNGSYKNRPNISLTEKSVGQPDKPSTSHF